MKRDPIFAAEQALRGDLFGWLHDHTEQEGECMIWQHGCWKDGSLPIMRLPRALPAMPKVKSKKVSVQRAVWEVASGKAIPKGWLVWATCGNKQCVNPDHIRAGTRKQMIDHKTRAGCYKLSIAEKIKRAKEQQEKSRLTWDDIRTIRAEMDATPSLRYNIGQRTRPDGIGRVRKAQELAARYGVSLKQIEKITRGDQWREQFAQQNPFAQLIGLSA